MKIHIVQKGDTLFEIAKNYGVNFEDVVKLNSQLSSPDMIMPGMKIKIPSDLKQVKSATDKAERVEQTQQEAKTTERPIGEMDGDDRIEPKEVHVKIPEEYEPLSSVSPIPKTVGVPKKLKQMVSKTYGRSEQNQAEERVVKQRVQQERSEGMPYRPVNESVYDMPKPIYHRPMSPCCCCCQSMYQGNPSGWQQRGTYYGNPYSVQQMNEQWNQMRNRRQLPNQQMNYMPHYEMNQMSD